MFDDYIRQQNVSLDYFENAAKNLQELNKELKEDNATGYRIVDGILNI